MTIISAIKTVTPKVVNAAKKFSGKPLAVTSKILGAAAIASVVYDTHVNGRENANACEQVDTADRMLNQYKQYMSSEKSSASINKFKKMWYDFQQSTSYYSLASRVKGYVSGAGKTLLGALPIIGLSAVALKFKTAGKVAGALLGLHGIKTLLYDVAGVGKKKTY